MIEPNRETYIKIPTSLGIRIVDLLVNISKMKPGAEIYEDAVKITEDFLNYMKTYDETDD